MLTLRPRARTLRSYVMSKLSLRSRGRRNRQTAALVGALLAAAFVVVPVATSTDTPTVEAAADDIIAIVIDGTGNGHGRGLSQWGAYGYAVDHGWGWQKILDHYYGGTISATTAAGQRIKVRLTAYDAMGEVGVISHGADVAWGSFRGASMRAVETSAGVFDIYSAPTIACPSASSLSVPNGPVVQSQGYNADAQRVQRFLRTFFDAGIAIDGYFGPQTAGVLAAWQADRGLPVDSSTWNRDDADEARVQIAAAGGSVSWTRVGTHTQTTANPVRFTTAAGDSAAADRSDVLGVCSSSGAVNHYRGAIEVVNSSDGNRVVNNVLAEAYVRGVIPKEIAASWAYAGGGAGANAVRAQAVAARSYGLQQNRDYSYPGSSTRYATTCDTTSCQVYGGSARRGSATGSATAVEHVATDAAVVATANVIRQWPIGHPKAGEVVSTEFSASNGPRTAGGAFPPVDDIGDDTDSNPYHRWTRIIDADTFATQNGLGEITGASMEPTTSPNYKGFDGIWFDDIVITGTATDQPFRQQAWDFRNAQGFRSPGFTVRVIRESTTNKSFGFIGDSVGNGITASNGEFMRVNDGTYTSITVDAVDSRCTTNESCSGTTGVTAAGSLPSGLDLVLVELGYNDNPKNFASDIDAMMTALNARGVGQVAWVNMADRRTTGGNLFYTQANNALAAAPSRWGNLTVLDWHVASNTSQASRWFSSDGVHLTATGEAEFALFLRGQLLELSPRHYLSPPKRIELPIIGEAMTAPNGTSIVVPQGAAGVSLNITMVRPGSRGFAAVWPCQEERPEVSSVNAQAGEVIANNVIAPISPKGTVCFYSSVGTDFVVDVAGWFPGSTDPDATDPFVGLLPERRIDTRSGVGGRSAQVTPDSPLVIPVAGVDAKLPDGTSTSVPIDAAAVAVNVTVTRADGQGFATVWPCGTDRPLASNVNYRASNPTSNGVVAPVGPNGTICIYTNRKADVIVDLVGYFDGAVADAPFTAATPTRLVDTREGLGAALATVGPAVPLQVAVRGVELTNGSGGALVVPDDATALAMNLTIVNPSGQGYATVWPCGANRPLASNVNFVLGRTRANSVVAPIGADGTVCIYVHKDSHVVVDVAGWFRGGEDPAFAGAVPERLVDTRASLGPLPE
jgi:peptidoglycan hydrolase-like protein with peptidoglycan-binding domain